MAKWFSRVILYTQVQLTTGYKEKLIALECVCAQIYDLT
jgi:hypothetical protein